ncbi:MAG: ABC transporter ATP-binding protein [Lachnospiraceae bacterium]|nr:ABC transporter ATP-binding protein [Lachnospiraceae bacterium]
MSEEYYFHTEGLTVGYDGTPLIQDICLRLRKGEILTLIGPNGAGKTTILKSLIRQLAPLAGTVFLDGRELASLSGHELSTKMSVVLTERVRPEMMTCEDVVATGRYPYTGRFGVLTEQDRRIVQESMDLVHIGDLAERDFTRTSDGQKQRVMLARAICQEPEILVLDEPTSFLDMKHKLEFLSILQDMTRTRRLSVILSLHELDLAERISDQVACVRGDRIARFGPPEEIFTSGHIPELFGLTVGSYDARTGDVELAAVQGEPQVFVLGGCGTATPFYRRLQREGTPFATGILWENDLDYPAAKALASRVLSVPAFTEAGEDILQEARALMESCPQILCPPKLVQQPHLPPGLRKLIRQSSVTE